MKLFGQLESAAFECLAADPTTGVVLGRVYYNTIASELRIYTGTVWAAVLSSATSTHVQGSPSSPIAITAIGGISPAGYNEETIFIKGNGSAIDVTANPQVAAGTAIGQVLHLIGTSNFETVLLENGTGLRLNGQWLAEDGAVLNLLWDGSTWLETSRN